MTDAEDGDGDWSVEDGRMESVRLAPGGVGSSLVATGWLGGLVGGVSISWQYCCWPFVVASEFSSMAFTTGGGDGEGERDMCCMCCGLVVERRWEEGWLVVSGGGGRSSQLLFAD